MWAKSKTSTREITIPLDDDRLAPELLLQTLVAVKQGDFTHRMPLDATGLAGKIYDTLNDIIDQEMHFTAEIARIGDSVGREGRFSQRLQMGGETGDRGVRVNALNTLIDDLVQPSTEIARVVTAVANGDLSQKMALQIEGRPVTGEFLQTATNLNRMVEQLGTFSAEVTRVAREVGTEGRLGGQAQVEGVAGTWLDLTNNVNEMARSLTAQVRDIAEVTTAVANGDLSRKITVDVRGEVDDLKSTINTMVDQLSAFAGEVTRVAREVGTEGQLGGQARVEGVQGTWKDLTDNVNTMCTNLTEQVRDIARVAVAVASGDLGQKINVDVRGEILDLKKTINTMVDQLGNFADQVTRVAREVGTEGQLGGQAQVEGVAGVWKNLTDSVNTMCRNLTEQVRDIAQVTTAVANGDLSKNITVEVFGEILELKSTINSMVGQLSRFAGEVTRVAGEVGTEGQLGSQATVEGVAGVWKDLTDNVNTMCTNLTEQVRDITQVTTAVANGDLTKHITVDVRGEIDALKTTINRMVDQLSAFGSEVNRVAQEVGVEGQLGGKAQVVGVAGLWKELTDNVNTMAYNLTAQVRDIATVATAVAQGDLSKKVTVEVRGEIQELKTTVNIMVDQLSDFAREVTRVAREVGTEGQLGGQAQVESVSGTWKELTDNVNTMAQNLTAQVRDIAEVTTAVANGDLTRQITVEVRGEILQLKTTINTMVDRLNQFANEVTRVAREVGTEGELGGQARVTGVAGSWQALTDNVNQMATNLTEQVRGIATVVTAVARGDLTRRLTVQAKGEVATLAETINEMCFTLSIFGNEVTRVAREVGVEGQLGGQAQVPGAEGSWRALTDNVNELASNLTTQVRAIGQVATAVAQGDLTQTITVDTAGEVTDLKDNVNRMIVTLQETTQTNQEQDWLRVNLVRFMNLIQGQSDLVRVATILLSELAPICDVHHGVFYEVESGNGDEGSLRLLGTYALSERKHLANRFQFGEGLIGQCALEKKRILLTEIPPDYVKVRSGVGGATPMSIIMLPVLYDDNLQAVIELASFQVFSEIQLTFLDQLTESLGIVLKSIASSARTQELLKESQAMSEELQTQQDELQHTNTELEVQARELEEQKTEVERKNLQVEEARSGLEERAEQLGIASKYKSEFLANMSHELRTPLNSLLILAKMLADNTAENLTQEQVKWASTIHGSGADLLGLINEILDLSRIEAGAMDLNITDVTFSEIQVHCEQQFQPVSTAQSLEFIVSLDDSLPPTMQTDLHRLQQVLRNLLSNAFKFTSEGHVSLAIRRAHRGWHVLNESLNRADQVIGFSVSDTGIGIPEDKQQTIFEAFQQADTGTARQYGGTGLGLSISRELARLLGGEIRLESATSVGSTFTLYLPQQSARPPEGATQPYRLPVESQLGIGPATAINTPEPLELNIFQDDRKQIQPGDRVALIIEDDATFVPLLADVARDKGFKCLIAMRGDTGLALAQRYKPDAIALDIRLPVADGWSVLDRLKHDPATRHIPVHIISVESAGHRALAQGAIAYLEKPSTREELVGAFDTLYDFVSRQMKELLIIEDNDTQRQAIVELIGNGDVQTTAVGTAADALEMLQTRHFDCVVLDLVLPDMSGFDLIEAIKHNERWLTLPIIVYTGSELTREQTTQLERLAETIIVKDVASPERLLDETALFLHRVETNLPESKQLLIRQAHQRDAALDGKKVLIVDDDVRNVFAMTAALEHQGVVVIYAENGQDALDKLAANLDVDIVLMDIMMPAMDGYEAIRRIRQNPQFRALPIIAVTAKAMKGDREKCLEAGASDYLMKPIENLQLFSLMRVWTYK